MADDAEMGLLETIRDLHRRDPFVPFSIVLTSGEQFTIQSSELLAIARSQLIYCYPKSDHIAHLRMNQIASVHELDRKPTRKRK